MIFIVDHKWSFAHYSPSVTQLTLVWNLKPLLDTKDEAREDTTNYQKKQSFIRESPNNFV